MKWMNKEKTILVAEINGEVKVLEPWMDVWENYAFQSGIGQCSEEELKLPLMSHIRDKRNTLLQQSDWTQVADAPVDQAAWATYRQALRDVTTQEGFPEAVVWPVAP